MNRRGFLTNLIGAAAGFAILPAATTYARKWVTTPKWEGIWVPNPEWVDAPYELSCDLSGGWGAQPDKCLLIKSAPDVEGRIPPRFIFNSITKLYERTYPFLKITP